MTKLTTDDISAIQDSDAFLPQVGKGSGWVPQPEDARDIRFRATTQITPAKASIRANMPRVRDQGQQGACHDDETSVLTKNGWELFKDLTGNEELATVDPETMELIYEKPTRLIRYSYIGPMITGNGQSLNFKVTPNHTMIVRKWNQDKRKLNDYFEAVRADEMGWYVGLPCNVKWAGMGSSTYTISGISDAQYKESREDVSVDMKDWLRFLGIFIAEGTLCYSENKKMYRVQIAAVKERERTYVEKILKKLDIKFFSLKDRYYFQKRQIFEELKKSGFFGTKAPFKRVPDFVFEQSPECIDAFLEGHWMGDGSISHNTRSHYTSSKGLAQDLHRLIFLSGKQSYHASRSPRTSLLADGRTIVGNYDENRVSVRDKTTLSIERKKQISEEFYNGEVFCAEVPSFHTLVTKRGGHILISGNCTGFATSYAIAALVRASSDWDTIYSPQFIYNNARHMIGELGQDYGAYIRDAVKSVNKFGAARENDFMYYELEQIQFKLPPESAYESARSWRLGEYRAISDLGQLKSALAAHHPVVGGFLCYQNLGAYSTWDTGIILEPTGAVTGGHAVCFTGYDDDKKLVQFINSWGSYWGDDGYGYLPYSFFETAKVSDMWALTRESELSQYPKRAPLAMPDVGTGGTDATVSNSGGKAGQSGKKGG